MRVEGLGCKQTHVRGHFAGASPSPIRPCYPQNGTVGLLNLTRPGTFNLDVPWLFDGGCSFEATKEPSSVGTSWFKSGCREARHVPKEAEEGRGNTFFDFVIIIIISILLLLLLFYFFFFWGGGGGVGFIKTCGLPEEAQNPLCSGS